MEHSTSTKPLLEIACFNAESALLAQQNGADRIELCKDYSIGGVTPDVEILSKLKEQKVGIPIYVMIRPRGGDFVHTESEFEQMKFYIKEFKGLADGFVFGILRVEGENGEKRVDIERNSELVKLAEGYPCTYHRAFDEARDLNEALEDVIGCGFKNVLTSGGKPNSVEGSDRLAELVEKAGDRLVVMPGGGIRSTNLEMLRKKIGAKAYHSAALKSGGEFADAEEVQRIKKILL